MAMPGVRFSKPIDIITAVQHYTGVDMFEKSRRREVVMARYIAMYGLRATTNLNLEQVGKICGNKNHATVLHAIKLINNLLEVDKEFKQEYKPLLNQFKL